MSNLIALNEIVEINPRMPKELLAKRDQRVSFVPMAAISEEGSICSENERLLSDVMKGYTYFQKGDVLLAKITPCFENGKAAVVQGLQHDTGFGSTEFHVLRPSKDVDAKYLFYQVWNPAFRFVGENNMTGTAGQKRVPTDFLKRYKIPLPPLAEQKRIAAILDKADAIRRKRQQAIKLAEDFLRATFLGMFGDPVTNPKGWEVKKFSQIGTLDRGVSKNRPRNAPELLGGPYPLIQTGDVANSNGYIRSYKSTYSEVGLKQSKMWSTGTLCITIAANIAKTGILTFDACFPDSVVGFVPNTLSTIEYVQYWLSFLQKILEDSAPESAQKNINLEILRNLDIPLPPINHQNEFSKHVAKVQALKLKQTTGSDNSSILFNSLTQRAFRGEL